MKGKYKKDSGRSSKVTPSCNCVVFGDKSALKKTLQSCIKGFQVYYMQFQHHHSSPVKMHMTVLSEEQRRHYCAIVAPVRYIFPCRAKQCLTNGYAVEEDAIAIKFA